MGRQLLYLALIAFCFALPTSPSRADEPAVKTVDADTLSRQETELLDQLLRTIPFDPRGMEFVSTPVTFHSAWGGDVEIERRGWRVAGKNGEPGYIRFADGERLPITAEAKLKNVDFVAACRHQYRERDDSLSDNRETFDLMSRRSVGEFDAPDAMKAVWLSRLGEKGLAARALKQEIDDWHQRIHDPGSEKVPTANQVLAAAKSEFATALFLKMVHAYMVRADGEALALGQRLTKKYPRQAKREPQVAAILAELERRKLRGTFGKEPAESPPAEFENWDVQKKVAYWIDALDEVDAQQMGQPGGVSLAEDRRVEALIKLGDAAVPALIDAIEKDERLTRSVHFWRDFSSDRTVLAVREAALSAVMSILRVQEFEPVATGDNFTSRGEDEGKETAERLRAYWKKHGGLPFDERMMSLLTDPKGNSKSWREAAENLATIKSTPYISTTVFSSFAKRDEKEANPVVEKFKKPTVAEAILAAMDRELAVRNANDKEGDTADQIEEAYFGPLVELADPRIAAELVRRFQTASRIESRRKLASVAADCGDSAPMLEIAKYFVQGDIAKISNDPDRADKGAELKDWELSGLVASLNGSHLPEADPALYALADPKHPLHSVATAAIFGADEQPHFSTREEPLFGHPFCISILRNGLNDTEATGKTYTIIGEEFKYESPGLRVTTVIPGDLADPALRNDRGEEQECDTVAEIINKIVIGSPFVHPLRKDRNTAIEQMKQLLDVHEGHFRVASRQECDVLDVSVWDQPCFIPAITPLGRPATKLDVDEGKAIFELKGKGRVADLKLPAIASLKPSDSQEGRTKSTNVSDDSLEAAEETQPGPPKVLIIQAEIDAAGVTHYGVISRHRIGVLAAEELTDVKPIEEEAK